MKIDPTKKNKKLLDCFASSCVTCYLLEVVRKKVFFFLELLSKNVPMFSIRKKEYSVIIIDLFSYLLEVIQIKKKMFFFAIFYYQRDKLMFPIFSIRKKSLVNIHAYFFFNKYFLNVYTIFLRKTNAAK